MEKETQKKKMDYFYRREHSYKCSIHKKDLAIYIKINTKNKEVSFLCDKCGLMQQKLPNCYILVISEILLNDQKKALTNWPPFEESSVLERYNIIQQQVEDNILKSEKYSQSVQMYFKEMIQKFTDSIKTIERLILSQIAKFSVEDLQSVYNEISMRDDLLNSMQNEQSIKTNLLNLSIKIEQNQSKNQQRLEETYIKYENYRNIFNRQEIDNIFNSIFNKIQDLKEQYSNQLHSNNMLIQENYHERQNSQKKTSQNESLSFSFSENDSAKKNSYQQKHAQNMKKSTYEQNSNVIDISTRKSSLAFTKQLIENQQEKHNQNSVTKIHSNLINHKQNHLQINNSQINDFQKSLSNFIQILSPQSNSQTIKQGESATNLNSQKQGKTSFNVNNQQANQIDNNIYQINNHLNGHEFHSSEQYQNIQNRSQTQRSISSCYYLKQNSKNPKQTTNRQTSQKKSTPQNKKEQKSSQSPFRQPIDNNANRNFSNQRNQSARINSIHNISDSQNEFGSSKFFMKTISDAQHNHQNSHYNSKEQIQINDKVEWKQY